MTRSTSIELFDGNLLAGQRVSAHHTAIPGPSPRRVGVVGAGILGASIAYHLAQDGAEVHIFEKAHPGSGATGDSFAWINATFDKRPKAYFDLNRLGMVGYRALEKRGLDLQVDWNGSLEWTQEESAGERLRLAVEQQRAWGYDSRLVDLQELRQLEPGLAVDAVSEACFTAEEGTVDPVAATNRLLQAAQTAGAVLLNDCEVLAIESRSGRLLSVSTTHGDFPVDCLVLAAGTSTDTLASLAGIQIPLVDSPGVLLHLLPPAAAPAGKVESVITRVVLGPEAHLLQRRDGRIVIGADFGGGALETATQSNVQELLRRATDAFPLLDGATIERVSTGWRPMPKDGFPIVGFARQTPCIYPVVTHSGVTLAPLLGRLAALEILQGYEVDLLAPFRPERF